MNRLSAYTFKLLLFASTLSAATLHGVVASPASSSVARHSAQKDAGDNEAARLVGEGVAAFERGDHSAARELFNRALALDPGNVDAHTFLGVIADQSGDLAAAERHFAAAAIAAPLKPSARNNHGAILLRMGRLREAAKQFEVSLRLDRNQPSALFNLAQIRFAEGTPDSLRESYELFQRAYAGAPDAETARSLVVAALRLGERDAAARHFRDYAATLARSTGEIARPRARAELGAALLENRLLEEAATELGAALTSEPLNVDYALLLARAHLQRKDIPAAGRTLESMVARGVESAPVYALLAEVYEAAGRFENAIPAMRLAIERDPRNESYRFRYGMLLTDTKAPAAAVIRLQEALKEFPSSSRLWFALGVAQSALDKTTEAAEAFRRAHELDPKFAPALAYLGMTYDQQGRYGEAVSFYERALALDDRLAAAHYLAAEAIINQSPSEVERASTHLKRAVALNPSFAPARVSLAKLHMRADRHAEAVAELQSAIASDPDLAIAHYQLGRALMRLKRNEEGRAALEKFQRLSEGQREQAMQSPREIMRRLANVRF